MIRLTESELANQLAESTSCDRSHDSNHALLEVLNHATTKVSIAYSPVTNHHKE